MYNCVQKYVQKTYTNHGQDPTPVGSLASGNYPKHANNYILYDPIFFLKQELIL